MQLKIERLKKRLADALPGEDAQYRMGVAARREEAAQANKETARKSAVLLLLYEHEGELHFPLIQRQEYGGVHSKQMAFPGGRHDEEDTDLVETAIRECWEEVGVQVNKAQIIGQLTELYIPPSNFLVTPVVAFAQRPAAFIPQEREVAQIYEVPLTALQDNAKTMRVEVRPGVWWQVPGYEVFGQTVWGATAMILSELLQVWEEI